MEAQNGDPELKDACLWLSASSERPKMEESGAARTYLQQWQVLQLRDGLLHRRWASTDGLQVVWQWIPPVRYRRALIQLTHGGMTSGHLGVARTQAQVQRRAYWVNWKADVQHEVKRCNPCAQYFRGTPARQGSLETDACWRTVETNSD